MPGKGMRSLFSSSHHHHHHQHRRHHHHDRRHGRQPEAAAPSTMQQTFSDTMMEENFAKAESIIGKWDPDTSEVAYLFGSGAGEDGRDEARRFLQAVAELHRVMMFYAVPSAASPDARSAILLRGYALLQTAMRRLERELHLLLSQQSSFSFSLHQSRISSSDDIEYDDDEIVPAERRDLNSEVEDAFAVAMADLRTVAGAMISAGYGQECVRVYKMMRKSVVDEAVYRFGFEQLTSSQIQKLDCAALQLKIRSWLAAVPASFKTIFFGERLLCDNVFPGSEAIRESCFAAITASAAEQLLAFPVLVTKSKFSPEKLFRILDLYNTVANLWTEIESMFSFKSTAAVRVQATVSLLKLAEAARATLAGFETAIQKEDSKALVPGGGVHPMTRYVMNYLALLADYEIALANIFSDTPLEFPNPLPESFFDSATAAAPANSPSSSISYEDSPRSSPTAATASSISLRLSWLVLFILCKLDGKAELYHETALSYLFLANNLQYIVGKVRQSQLRLLLGNDWVAKHGAKARRYAASYARLAWAKVAAAIPADQAGDLAPEVAQKSMRAFNTAMEAACRGQAEWVVADGRMRDEVRAAVAGMVVPAYRVFYERCRAVLGSSGGGGAAAVVRFAPEDVRNRIYGLFDGSTGSSSSMHSSEYMD